MRDMARQSIRSHLKYINQETNLYCTVPKLGLPRLLEAYLLYDTNLSQEEAESSQGTDGEIASALNIQDENGMTALMNAALSGDTELVEGLIKAGASVDIQASFGDTALMCATKANNRECVEKLVHSGANVNLQGANGKTSLAYASSQGNLEILELLLQNGVDPEGWTALMGHGNSDCLSTLIKAGAKVNLVSQEGATALHKVASRGEVGCVQKLISAGADLNDNRRHDKYTPLMLAAMNKHDDCVKVLIRAGADLNIKTPNGDTALMIGAKTSASRCVRTLLDAGAEVDMDRLADIASVVEVLPEKEGNTLIIYLSGGANFGLDLFISRCILTMQHLFSLGCSIVMF